MADIKIKETSNRVLFALLFAFVFSVVGHIVPNVYYQFIDDTQYLEISQPISTDRQTYRACDTTELTVQLDAKIDVSVETITQLVLVKVGGEFVRVGEPIEARIPIKAVDKHIVQGSLLLPCDIEAGNYYWQGIAIYKVREFTKELSFITETFEVTTDTQSTN
jgi:hypothetical protein